MNKNTFLCFIVIFFYCSVKAQVQPGKLYADVSVSRYVLRFNNTVYQASLSAGLTQHSTLGLFFSHTRYDASASITGFDAYSTKTGGGVTYNYYRYFNSHSKWGWYANVNAGIFNIRVLEKTSGSYQLNNRYWQQELTVSPGIFFTPSRSVMLYAGLGGITLGSNKYQLVNLSSGFVNQLTIGARITIGGSKKKSIKPGFMP